MEKIGKSLRDKRLERGLSLEQMNEKTKLSIAQLEAIEKGDIAFFRDDLSYLSYFVRYYANALDMNYDDLRSELDHTISEYTTSISLYQIKKQESLSTNIKSKSKHTSQYKSTVIKPKKKIVDLRTFGLIALALIIIASLGFVLVNYIPAWLNQDPIDRPVINLPGDVDETDEDEPDTQEPEEKPAAIEVVAIDPNNYEIRGLKLDEAAELKVIFNEPSWTQFKLDNVKLSEPKEATYQPGSEAIVKTTVKDQQVVSIHFGRLQGNTLEINGTPIVLDEAILNAIVSTLSFKFVVGG